MDDQMETAAGTTDPPPAAPGMAAAQARLAAASTETPESLLMEQQTRQPAARSGSRPLRRPHTAPGPAEYTPSKERHKAPAWSFGKASGGGALGSLAVQQAKSMEPGPVPEKGREIKNPNLYQAPKFSFGKGKSRSSGPGILGGGSADVGPGTYTWDVNVRSTSHRAPAHKILGRPAAAKLPPQGTDPGDLFKSSTLVMGQRGDGSAESLAAKLAEGHMLSASEMATLKTAAKKQPRPKSAAADGGSEKPPATGADGFKENLDGALNVDWAALTAKLPTGKDAASVAKRKDLWRRADPNGNGYLSLAEVDMLVKDAIGREVFSAKPAIAAAFHAARKSGGGAQEGRAADYVERKEFRTLFVMLRQYYELYAMFNRLDTSDDRRIDLGEFKEGSAMVKGWGVELPEESLPDEFASIDADGGGLILFQEFAKWALEKALDLPDDDDFDGKEAAQHQSIGYLAEKGGGMMAATGFHQREPAPKLCYTHMGAQIPVQTTAKADVKGSPQSQSRATVSPVFQTKGFSNLPVLGGVPMRTIKPNTHLYPNTKISRHGMPAGLPYALGQMLLAKSREDRAAYEKASKRERIYGALSLEPPPPPKPADAKGGGAAGAIKDQAGPAGEGAQVAAVAGADATTS